VAQTIPAEIDADLAGGPHLTGASGADSSLAAVSEWGPPEETARALVAAAGKPDEPTRKAALERLGEAGETITKAGLLPPAPAAPAPDAAPEPYLALWRDWYRARSVSPSEGCWPRRAETSWVEPPLVRRSTNRVITPPPSSLSGWVGGESGRVDSLDVIGRSAGRLIQAMWSLGNADS